MTPPNVVIMRECSSICGDRIAKKLVQHWESAELGRFGWDLVSASWVARVHTGVCYQARRNMNLHMWYICRKGTCNFTIFNHLRMLQLSERSIWQYRKHNFPFMRSSGPCLQNSLHNNVAVVNGRGREFGTQRGDTGVEKEWKCTMHESGVMVSIHALINDSIANKWVINSHWHSGFTPSIQ